MDELKKIIDFFKDKKDNDDKDNRKHSIIMLAIYSIFLIVVVITVRTGSDSSVKTKEIDDSKTSNIKEEDKSLDESNINNKNLRKESDVNYSYMYTVTIDGEVENYIGKKCDDKEKFSYIKGDNSFEYAIKDDNYFILEGDIYHITDKLDSYFKYCDIEKILSIVEEIEPVIEDDKLIFNVENSKLSYVFGDVISDQTSGLNNIAIKISNDTIIGADLNLSSYISSIIGGSHTLIIKMEYANVGKVEDFSIKLK